MSDIIFVIAADDICQGQIVKNLTNSTWLAAMSQLSPQISFSSKMTWPELWVPTDSCTRAVPPGDCGSQ